MSEHESSSSTSWFLPVATDGDLRQGDVVFQWRTPLWRVNTQQFLVEPEGRFVAVQVPFVAKRGAATPVVICSHDCELDNESKNRRGVIVAPVLPWPYPDTNDAHSLTLIASRLPKMEVGEQGESQETWDFINLWPLQFEVTDGSGETPILKWHVADFSALVAMATADKVTPLLRSSSRLEMTDDARRAFSRKLAAFFWRSE